MLMDKAPPFVTAKSWAIFDCSNEKLMFGKFESDRREVASLTKLMVAYAVVKICERFEIDIESHLVEVT
jgi:D-alanyl-D-alanine carboxypeptidase